MKITNSKFWLISLTFILIPCFANAQDKDARKYVIERTNIEKLQEIAKKSKEKQKKFAEWLSRNESALMKTRAPNNDCMPVGLDKYDNIEWACPDGIDQVVTNQADKVQPGGQLGLDLTGAGIEVALWDTKCTLPTHIELEGRVTEGDECNSYGDHATHCAGIIISEGIDSDAIGMAPEASIRSYLSGGISGEIAEFASTGGLMGSNSTSVSGDGGVYGGTAEDVDEVSYHAPYFILAQSAGNKGEPYHSIRHIGVAKNVMVVGNSNDMLDEYEDPSSIGNVSSSSYGPTGDWRIKPDIVGNGYGVYSTESDNDTDYGNKTGTSMAAPGVAGCMVLLQDHYRDVTGVYMRSATVRGLVINTAYEAGSDDGPDFKKGWGQINTAGAVKAISNMGKTSIIDELTLKNGETYTRTVYSDGSSPTSLTICWTDPQYVRDEDDTPLHQTILVNDLDVRIIGAETYKPWVMVPNDDYDNFTDPAEKGDNYRDNVERIDAVLPAGTYTIRVTHEGSLTDGKQDFSLIATGLSDETPTTVTYQAEDASLGGGSDADSNHDDYNGTGFVNFSTNGGSATFKKVYGGDGGSAIIEIRFALCSDDKRTGQLVVNGNSENVTFSSTGSCSNWSTLYKTVLLNSGWDNTLALKSTGQDLANIDQIIVIPGDDSGGSDWIPILYDDFESGYGNWNDGGDDSILYEDGAYAFKGNNAVNLQDNSSSSLITTDKLDLSGYSQIKVDFAYYAISMDSKSEDFWLQLSTNGGSSYTTAKEWDYSDEFENGKFYQDSAIITGFTLTNQTKLRFRCDASGNSDDIYIDEVVVSVADDTTSKEISNISVASGKTPTTGIVSENAVIYSDRDYKMENIPSGYTGLDFIKGHNEDKDESDDPFLTFDISGSATIYLVLDTRRSSLPGWASGWNSTGDQIDSDDKTYDIYSKSFSAGSVELGPNNLADYRMYWVMAEFD